MVFCAVLGLGFALASAGSLVSLWTAVVHRGINPQLAQLAQVYEPTIARGFFFSLVLVGCTVALIWLRHSKGLAAGLLAVGTGLLLSVDLIRVDGPYIQTLDYFQWSRSDPNDTFLMERLRSEPPFRVISLRNSAQDVRPTLYGLDLATGHHPNDLAPYRELIGMRGSSAPENIPWNPAVTSLLNVRYLIWPLRELGQPEGLEPVSATSVQGQPYEAVYEIPTLPRARLVGRATLLAEERVVPYLLGPGFDPAAEVVLSEPPGIELPDSAVVGTVTWVERSADRLVLDVETPSSALLALSENWFPGWVATVDGREAPVLRAYHALRAVPVPAGASRIEMRYTAPTVRRGAWVSGAATLFLLLAFAAELLRRARASSAADA